MTREQYERLTAAIVDGLIEIRRAKEMAGPLTECHQRRLEVCLSLLKQVVSDLDREHRR